MSTPYPTPIGTTNVVPMSSPIIEEWCDWMTAQGLSQRTIRERQLLFHRLGKDLDLTVGDMVKELSRPEISNSTKQTYTNHLRAFFAWAKRMEYVDKDPTKKLPVTKVPRSRKSPVTDAELQKLLASRLRARTRAMILLCAFQGLRIHEAVKVQSSDIDLTKGTLTVVGKGGVSAELPLSDVIRNLAATMPTDGYWFPSGDGHVKANSASGIVGLAMRRAGVPGSAHSLRRWYATQLLRRGANMRVVQELMRHASPATTAIYAQPDAAQMRAAIDSLAA